jgi:ATP-dependent helicase HrpB
LLVAAELDDLGAESRIFLAAPLDMADLTRYFGELIREETVIAWDSAAKAVRGRKRSTLGALLLKETPLMEWNPDAAAAAWVTGIREEGLAILPWTKVAEGLRKRIRFMAALESGWPDVSMEALRESLEEWLVPHLYGMRSAEELKRLNLPSILEGMLTWEQRRGLDEEAPTHITVPSGSRIPIDYADPEQPVLAVRLQEMFGMTDTPRIGRGRVPLTVHLLSPAQRPVQVTKDLASFWRTGYFDVKKDLKGRYPKHYWPDDPTAAVPTNRVRPRT